MSKGLRQKERCRREGSGPGSDGPGPRERRVCYLPGVPGPTPAREGARRGRGPGSGQPVCKLDPGRAGTYSPLCGGNRGGRRGAPGQRVAGAPLVSLAHYRAPSNGQKGPWQAGRMMVKGLPGRGAASRC